MFASAICAVWVSSYCLLPASELSYMPSSNLLEIFHHLYLSIILVLILRIHQTQTQTSHTKMKLNHYHNKQCLKIAASNGEMTGISNDISNILTLFQPISESCITFPWLKINITSNRAEAWPRGVNIQIFTTIKSNIYHVQYNRVVCVFPQVFVVCWIQV